jgi:glycosyltransferase involved in cell wall biosynthesis
MDKRHPKVTVITVCYNAATIIEETILSVVNQTYDNIEYIVIDGGSKDGTQNIIEKYSSKLTVYVSEPDNGIYDAMNKAINMATGDWVNFMNAGDKFCNNDVIDCLVSQIEDDTIIAYGDTMYVYKSRICRKKHYQLSHLKRGMPLGHQASFISGDYHRAHPFDLAFKSSGDYDFFYKAYFKDAVKFQYVPIDVVYYEAENGMSSTNYKLVSTENAIVQGKKIDTLFRIKLQILYYMSCLKRQIRYTLRFIFK